MDALNLCRTANNEAAWACLAVLALQTNSDIEDIAEEAFANINQHEKVYYLNYIKVNVFQFVLSFNYFPIVYRTRTHLLEKKGLPNLWYFVYD